MNTAPTSNAREELTWEHDGHSRIRTASWPGGTSHRAVVIFIVVATILGLLLVVATPRRLFSQGVQLVKVDIAVVAQGYRFSKLSGSSVVNDKNERIGSIDDLVVAKNKSLFAVLQVGGFLGIGGRLVAVPYESLRIDDEAHKIELPGASADELRKLVEFKYRS